MIDSYIKGLVTYAIRKGFIGAEDRVWAINAILALLKKDDFNMRAPEVGVSLSGMLSGICDWAAEHGVIDGGIASRDLFDTALMGVLTPRPSEVIAKFNALYEKSPEKATDWYYAFSGDTNYIRRDRIKKDLKWQYDGEYGTLDITINLSKPEKDPKAIAAAKNAPQSGYPKCNLCRESEGYAGNLRFPARQNHRVIPIEIADAEWFLQYSPYVYYNEHCIVLSAEHAPMKIDRAAFCKLLDFVTLFPHYFVGSNADLPIVGGSILSHEHFQGGRYEFPMERAPIEKELVFPGFPGVKAGVVKWPMSTIRLQSADKTSLADLAEKILNAWRGYTDEEAFIFAETDGEKHNTITPIARRRGSDYELDLVLRNNITTEEHPLGVYHPHAELHHIKKENIGLIEVMGLAVLPARLKTELAAVEETLVSGADPAADPLTAAHAAWIEELRAKYPAFTPETVGDIVRNEVGLVFATVLEHAGVFKRDDAGRAAFSRFTDSVK
ncbi:MAG: UDP-glucose--hexose-1-phosphate uridylyltransferase [Clostridia bacterium]|nr:UDP-glucose--hexose-1-phosphate uridylyltransferase [Clostridia bacterium]